MFSTDLCHIDTNFSQRAQFPFSQQPLPFPTVGLFLPSPFTPSPWCSSRAPRAARGVPVLGAGSGLSLPGSHTPQTAGHTNVCWGSKLCWLLGKAFLKCSILQQLLFFFFFSPERVDSANISEILLWSPGFCGVSSLSCVCLCRPVVPLLKYLSSAREGGSVQTPPRGWWQEGMV